MPIQRFDNWGKMERDGEGAFVSYSDHVAALATARREALEEAAKLADEHLTYLQGPSKRVYGYAVRDAALLSERIRALPLDHIPDAGKVSTGGGDEG